MLNVNIFFLIANVYNNYYLNNLIETYAALNNFYLIDYYY